MFWTDGSVLFPLAKAALASLPTAYFVALRPHFPFRMAHYVQVSLLKPAPFCKLSAGLGSTSKSAISLIFSSSLTLCLSLPLFPFPHLSFYLELWKIWQKLPSLFTLTIRLQWAPEHLFLPGNVAADKLVDGKRYSLPSAIPFSLPPLTSRIHSCLFSDCRRTDSSKFFDTQVLLVSTEELLLPRHVCCALFCLRCNGHSLLLSPCLSRTGRIESPSCNACGHPTQYTSHLIVHYPAADSLRRSLFGNSLSLCDLWARLWGDARLLRLRDLSPSSHPSEGVR